MSERSNTRQAPARVRAGEGCATKEGVGIGAEMCTVGLGEWPASAYGYWPRPILAATGFVVLLGTSVMDVTQDGLLLNPVTFLLAANGACTILRHAMSESLISLNHPTQTAFAHTVDFAARIGTGIAILAWLATVSAGWGVLWLCGLLCGAFPVYSAMLAVPWLPSMITARAHLLQVGEGMVRGEAWLVVWLLATIPPTFFDELSYHLVVPQ